MTGRDRVLARVRAALAGATPPDAAVPRAYRRHGDLLPGDPGLVEVFVDRLTDYGAGVHRGVPVAATVTAILAASGARPAGGDAGARPVLAVPVGLSADWVPDTVEVIRDDGLALDRLAVVDGVLTAASVAIAETGTVVLDGSPDQGRRALSLLADLHICVVRTDQVVAGVPEALTRLVAHRPQTWISGPSATSDIELDRVEGVHGPRRLHVILTGATPRSGTA